MLTETTYCDKQTNDEKMALGNFRSLKIIRLLILVFIALPVVSANVDCGGKAFHCVNTTHFKICVDLGGGVSKTIDSLIIPCPVSTECKKTNRYECEFPKPVILETVSATSVPDELSPVTVATTVSADTSGLTPTEFLQFVTSTSESSKTELYKITTDISVVDKTKSFKVPASNSEQRTTEFSQTLINTNTPTDTELIEVPIGTSVTNATMKTELYQTSNQTGLKDNIMNTSEFSQGLTEFTTPATIKNLEISSGIRLTNKSKYSQVLDIQSEVTQEAVEMSAPITTEIFKNLKDKIILNETETFEVLKNTSVTNNIGYKQDPTEASESIKTETTKLSKQTGLINESEFYQEPVFTSVPSTTETLRDLTYTSVPSKSDFSKSHNGINELMTAEMFQTSTDGIIPNETELFESSTTSRVLKKSDIFQGPDEISATITTESFQYSSVANEPNKTELFETLIDLRVLNTSENYKGPDGISEHEMLQTSSNAPKKPEVLETFTNSRILNISDMFQKSDSINAPLTTEISENSTVANELNKTELFESSTDSKISNETVLSQRSDKTRALITAKIFNTTTNASALKKTNLFEVSTDANYYETVTNQPDLFEAVLDTRLPIIIKVSQTIPDTNEHFVLQSNSSGTYTQRSKDTVGNNKNVIVTENSVSNKSVLHQGHLEITTPFKINVLKTSIESNILNITEIFQAPAVTNLTTFDTTESPQATISKIDKNYTTTFSPRSKAPLKVTHPSIVTKEQGVENQIEWSNVTSIIDSAKENHNIIDFNNHTALATEDSNSNDLSNQNITTKVNNIFIMTKNVSSEHENSTAINSFVDNDSNNFIKKKQSNGHNDLLMSLNKEYTSDATESDNLINSVSNPNDLGIMVSSNRPIDSTTYDTTESHFTTLASQDFTAETVSNKNNEDKVIEVNGYTSDVNTFAVLTPPTVTIQDYSYYNTELQDFPSITTENSATSNNNFVPNRIMKTTILNETILEAINNKNNVSADEINTSSVYVTNKETVKVLEATDPPYKVLTPVFHNSATAQDWGAVGTNPQLEITTNAITSSQLNSKDHVEFNLNTPESYINISKGLHKATVINDLFSKNTSKINVPEASENSNQIKNMHTEQIEYLRNVSTLPPTDSQIKSTDAATKNSIFKAVESAITIVKELTQPRKLSPAAKTEFQTPSSLVANSFDLEQTSSINSLAETNADHKKYFVTESNKVDFTTTDAATETSIFKAVESAATIVKELTYPQKLSPTSRSIVANGFDLEQTSSINLIAKTSVDYNKHFVTESNIVESKTTDAATETSIFKAVESVATIVKELTYPQKLSTISSEQTGSINSFAKTSEDYKKQIVTKSNIKELKAVESAATDVKELTQPQKLSPRPSSLVANSVDLGQTGSINSIAETNADNKKNFVTESNIVESTSADAATETSILKAEDSAATAIKELTQPQKLSPTPSSLVANGFDLGQTGSINSIAKTSVDYKKYFETESNIVESKTTDAAAETSIFKAVESAATIVKELTYPQKLSPTSRSIVANGFDLEQTSSINSIAKTSVDYNKHFVTESNIVESKTTDAATETSIFKAVESVATIVKELTYPQKLSTTSSEQTGSINSFAKTSEDYKKQIVTKSNKVELKAVESAATDVKELTQPQKLSPTPSSLVANSFDLGQSGSINSIAETNADHKKNFVTESNIESTTTDAATDTSIFKAVDSADTAIKELTQPQKLSPTPSILVANGFDLEQTGSINSITDTTLDYKEIVIKESNIVESTTYLNYLDNTESNLGNGQNLITGKTKKTTPSGADLQHFTEQISAANIAEKAFPTIHEQKILYSKDIDLEKNANVQHNPSETSLKEQSTQQRAINTLDKQTKRVNQNVTAVHNLNINNTQFNITSEPFFTVSDTQVGVIPIGTNSTKNDSTIAHSFINHMNIPTSSNTYYSEAKSSNADNDGSRMSLELPDNKLNESKHNEIQSTLTSLLNNTIREPTVDLVNKLEGFKNTTDNRGLGANKAVTKEADLKINSTSILFGVSKDKASETSFKTHPSESTTKYRDFINTTSHLNKDLVLQRKIHVNGSKDTKKDNLSQTELKKYNEITKSVISKNDTLRSNVRGSTNPHNTTYVSDIRTFEAPNNKPYAVKVEAESFINSNTYIKTNHTHNSNGSISEVLNVDRTQISNIPKAKINIVNDVLNKPISLLSKVSENFTLLNKSVTERIQLSANGNYTNFEKDQLHAAHNEHINTTVRSMNETEYNKTIDRLPENKTEHRKEDKSLLTNDEHNKSQNKRRNLTVSRELKSASHLISDHHSVLPSNIKGSSLTPIIDGRQKVSTQINPKRSVITIPKYIEKDIALVNQTQRTVLANVNNNFTSTIARKTTKIIRAHATINNEKKNISFNCRHRNRGRYSDTDDCNKFYICIGKLEPIIGRCPVNTVFSELKKQCTNNMSHCVRGSEFKCTAVGRFIDIFKHNVYYICLKSNQHFIRFKFQCQKGYYLNKTLLKCIADSELEMQSQTSVSNDNSKSEISNNEDNKSNKDISKTRHSQKSGEDFECEEEGKFEDKNDCRRYYVCKKNHKSEFRRRKKKCDSDELFHKDRKKCVDAESYEC